MIEPSRWRRDPPTGRPGSRRHARSGRGRQPISRALTGVTLLALALASASPARAQSDSSAGGAAWETRAWVGDLTFLSLNALIGGLTAGLLQTLRGGSIEDGFGRGAIGGAVAFGGRRVAAADFIGAGLMGRQIAGVGASMVRNASEGAPTLSRLSFPVGPLVLIVDRRANASSALRMEVDAVGATMFAAALLDDRLEMDGRASLSAGAPVFRTPGHRLGSDGDHPNGSMILGLILLGYDADYRPGSDVLAHERVHVLQYDFTQEVWGDPLEDWIGDRLGLPAAVRFVRPGVAVPLVAESLAALLDLRWEDRIWEIEADYLEHR